MSRTGDMPRWDDRILNGSPPTSTSADDQLQAAIAEIKNHVRDTATMHNNVLGRLANEIQYLTETVRTERAENVDQVSSVAEQVSNLSDKVDELQGQYSELHEEIKTIRREFFQEAERVRQQIRFDNANIVDVLQHLSPRNITDIERDVDVINEATRRVLDQVSKLRETSTTTSLSNASSITTSNNANNSNNNNNNNLMPEQRRQPPPMNQMRGASLTPLQRPMPSVHVPSNATSNNQMTMNMTSANSNIMSMAQVPSQAPVQANLLQRRPPPLPPNTSISHPTQQRSEPSPLLYVMAVNIRSVKDMWIEYANGINGGPSIRSLEAQHGTAWRGGARSAQSRKFQRQRAVYDAIERGIELGKSADECCQELEDLRVRSDGKWYSLTWLLHNIPSTMFEN